MKAETEALLRAHGWTYIEDCDQECGSVSEHGDSGWCPRIGHWIRPGAPYTCGTHARIACGYDLRRRADA